MDFFIDEKILNFLDKPPQKPPAVEQVRPERFTIPQLRTINEELRMSKARPNEIENQDLVDLLQRKTVSPAERDHSGEREAVR